MGGKTTELLSDRTEVACLYIQILHCFQIPKIYTVVKYFLRFNIDKGKGSCLNE